MLPYWTKTRDAVDVRAVIELDNLEGACYSHVWGCFLLEEQVIYLLKSLDLKTKECVLTHELKHAAGFSHEDKPNYAVDCGTGETWIAPITKGNTRNGGTKRTSQ